MILDDPNYMTGSFDSFFTKDTDYFTWFLQSLIELVLDDCLMSGGRVLGSIAHAHRASVAHLGLQVDTL